MTMALRGLKVKVKVNVIGRANAVGPTSMKGSFSSLNKFVIKGFTKPHRICVA